MKRRIFLTAAVAAGLALPGSSPAQDSETIIAAKRAGQIGERYDGYIGYVTIPTAILRRQVDAVNIRRRSLYSGLAARKGVSPEEVGITAACSLLRRSSIGEYYLPGEGGWRRVTLGQSPVPSYCG
jgi:uncharacterized protein YdbL (DUF1318 family)